MQSGTPYWVPAECEGTSSERSTPLSNIEKSYLKKTLKLAAASSGQMKTMEFLQPSRKKERGDLTKHINEVYGAAALMGQVRSFPPA